MACINKHYKEDKTSKKYYKRKRIESIQFNDNSIKIILRKLRDILYKWLP